MEHPRLRFPLAEIRTNFSRRYLERVLYRVKDHYPRSSPQLTKNYSRTVDGLLKLNRGNRRMLQKSLRGVMSGQPGRPPRVFPDLVLHNFKASDEVANAFLELWMDAEPQLRKDVSNELKTRDEADAIQGRNDVNGKVLPDGEAIQKFEEKHPGYSREDV